MIKLLMRRDDMVKPANALPMSNVSYAVDEDRLMIRKLDHARVTLSEIQKRDSEHLAVDRIARRPNPPDQEKTDAGQRAGPQQDRTTWSDDCPHQEVKDHE